MTSIEAPAGPGRAVGAAAPRFVDLGLRLEGRPCLVVGGGVVGARKAALLLEGGAAVTVVAPTLGAEMAAFDAAGALAGCAERPFVESDIEGCVLVVAATDDAAVNREVAEACRRRGVLVNVVDHPELSDVVMPATVRRGALHLAVSTSGLAPALAAAIARRLAALYPEEWGDVVSLLGEDRERAFSSGLDGAARRARARELASLDFEGLLEAGGVERVRQAVEDRIGRYEAGPARSATPAGGAPSDVRPE